MMLADMWRELHKVVDHTILIPTLEAFRVLGHDVQEPIQEADGSTLMRRLWKHHMFPLKIAILSRTDTLEVHERDS